MKNSAIFKGILRAKIDKQAKKLSKKLFQSDFFGGEISEQASLIVD